MLNLITSSIIFFLLFNAHASSQWTYGTPFSTASQQSSWQQVLSKVSTTGNPVLDNLTAPYPTNAWFNMFFLYGTAYPNPQGNLGQNNCWVNPYSIGFGYNYIGYSNQRALLGVNYKPFAIDSGGGSFPFITWDGGAYMYFGTTNPANFVPAILNDYSDLSATIKFYNTSNTNNYFYAPLVRGIAVCYNVL